MVGDISYHFWHASGFSKGAGMLILRAIALMCVLMMTVACEGRDYSGKTFFKSQPLNLPLGAGFFDAAPDEHVVANEIFKDFKLDVAAVYRMSRGEEKLGAYFSSNATTNKVSVGALAGDYDLFNQKIIYYDPTSGYQAPLVRGTFYLRPREVVRGLAFSARKWLGKFYCDVALTCGQAEHEWQLDIKDAVIDPVTFQHAISFFQGAVKTTTQNPLKYATIVDNIPTNGYEVFNCMVTSGADIDINGGGRVGLFGQVIIPAASYKYHNELFFPVVGNVGHMGFGVGARSLVTLAQTKKLTVGCFSVARATKFFNKDEMRVPGVQFSTSVGQASELWAQYTLGKKTTASVYDPVINLVGPQLLGVVPGPEVSLEMGMFFEGASGVLSLGYKSWLRGDEELTLRNQPDSAILYNRVLASGTYGLSPDLENCRVPAVATHTLSLEGVVYVRNGTGSVRGLVGYEWPTGNAALHNVVASLGVNIAF